MSANKAYNDEFSIPKNALDEGLWYKSAELIGTGITSACHGS